MISRPEVDDLISKLASEKTRVRVDLLTTETSFSVAGFMEVAAAGVMRVKLRDAGFIEFFLGDSWGFDYFDPNSTRTPLEGRIGQDYEGNPQETGPGIVGWVQDTEYHLFILEIVEAG